MRVLRASTADDRDAPSDAAFPPLPAEARGGLHIVEQSIWSTVPLLLRRISSARACTASAAAAVYMF